MLNIVVNVEPGVFPPGLYILFNPANLIISDLVTTETDHGL